MSFLLFGAKPKPQSSEQRHQITLANRCIAYTLRRSPRRRLSLSIDHRGLRVLGPMSLTLRESESMIRAHADWVLKKLDRWQTPTLVRSWTLADPLPFQGRLYLIQTQAHAARSPRVETSDDRILLHTSTPEDLLRNHRALVQWLRAEALIYFQSRVAFYAPQIAVQPTALSLSQARTRWGSCTAQGHIRLNWRLIHLPQTLVDYVVIHELAHLKEMNHSPRFWALVETLYPEYKAARKLLRGQAAGLPLIQIKAD